MNTKDGNGNIEVWVFVVDGWEAEGRYTSFREISNSKIPVSLRSTVIWIAKELDLNRLVAECVLAEKGHNLV